MSKKNFYNLEDQIKDAMKTAFDAIDFAGIKKDINHKTEDTLNDVKMKLKNKSQYFNEKLKDKVEKKYRNVNTSNRRDGNDIQAYIAKRPSGSISGMIYKILGILGCGVFGTSLIVCLISILVSDSFFTINYIGLGVFLFFFIASTALILKGRQLRKRVKRFKKYVTCLDGKKSYCLIEELAVSVGKKNKFVVKDLRKMIELGMFPQAHVDDKQAYFMLNDAVYDNYLESQESFKKRNEEELKNQEKLKEEINDPNKKELRYTIEEGKDYVNQIKIISDNIHGEEISEKLSKLQDVVSQVFNYIENNPKRLPEINKLVKHYLPMTLKLIKSYKELDDQQIQGDNIKNAKNEIEKAIDSINIAFANLLDDLFEEVAMDISTDISVLKTLFTQEGLTKKDFEK